MGKILRPCEVCGRLQAEYLVPSAEPGKQRLCYACWKSLHTGQPPVPPRVEQIRLKRKKGAKPKE